MVRHRLQYAFALLLALLLVACGGRGSGDATPTADVLPTLDLGDGSDDPPVGTPAAPTVANAAPPAPADGAVSDAQRGEVEDRLRALGLTPPPGASLVEVDDLNATDIDVDFLVPSMSPAELMDFYLTALPAAGYEISSQDDDEIDFRSDGARGEIDVSARDGGTLLELDIEEQ